MAVKVIESIEARGHPNILSTHKTTFEVTRDSCLTKRGDCVIAVGATKGAADLRPRFKEAARKEGAPITIAVEVGDEREVIKAVGSPKLSFLDPNDLVVRRSDYVCGRTVAIRADKAAIDLSRKLVEKLRSSSQIVKIVLSAECY